MVHPQDDPRSHGGAPADGRCPGGPRDPVRIAVHMALAIYLSPILMIVALIGGVSLLAGGVARAAAHVAYRPVHPVRDGRKVGGVGRNQFVHRLDAHRGRSHAAR